MNCVLDIIKSTLHFLGVMMVWWMCKKMSLFLGDT